MSDPVTNVEIEDVLSSIRRLVSDGDKARTRDPAPVMAHEDAVFAAPIPSVEAPEIAESTSDRFVLTPAFMVVDNNADPQPDDAAAKNQSDDSADLMSEDDEHADWVEEKSDNQGQDEDDQPKVEAAAEADVKSDDKAATNAEHGDYERGGDEHSDYERDGDEHDDEHTSPNEGAMFEDDADEALPLTDIVWDSVDDARKAGIAAVPEAGGKTAAADIGAKESDTPDRASLVATIAELEAAVGTDIEDYEPDGSEVADHVTGETIAWPGAAARSFDDIPEAEAAGEAAPVADLKADVDNTAPSFEHHRATDALPHEVEDSGPDQATLGKAGEDATLDDYGDDDLDGLLEVGGVSLDEEALRELVADVVREELTGPLGERITRNVRKLVRREIYRILSSQEFD